MPQTQEIAPPRSCSLQEIGQPRLVIFRSPGDGEICVRKTATEIANFLADLNFRYKSDPAFRFVAEMGAYVNTHFVVLSSGRALPTVIIYV